MRTAPVLSDDLMVALTARGWPPFLTHPTDVAAAGQGRLPSMLFSSIGPGRPATEQVIAPLQFAVHHHLPIDPSWISLEGLDEKTFLSLLWGAVRDGSEAVVQAVLDTGRCFPGPFMQQYILGHLLKEAPPWAPSMIGPLCRMGADPNAAIGTGLPPLAETGQPALWKALVMGGARVDLRLSHSSTLQTFMDVAMSRKNMAFARFLLEHGFPVNMAGHFKTTPLMGALNGGEREMALHLLELQADPNLENQWGMTALMYAAAHMPELVGPLLDHGADRTFRDQFGRTVMDHARQKKGATEDHALQVLETLQSWEALQEKAALEQAVSGEDIRPPSSPRMRL
jgi:hypothetical protein